MAVSIREAIYSDLMTLKVFSNGDLLYDYIFTKSKICNEHYIRLHL